MKKIYLQFSVLLFFTVLILTAFTKLKKKQIKVVKLYSNNVTIAKANNPYYFSTSSKRLKLSNTEWKSVFIRWCICRLAMYRYWIGFYRKILGYWWKRNLLLTAYSFKLFGPEQNFLIPVFVEVSFEQLNTKSVVCKKDNSLVVERTEVLCGKGDWHLWYTLMVGQNQPARNVTWTQLH